MKGIYYIDRLAGELRQEIVPGEEWLQWLYENPLGKLTLQAMVKRKFLSQLYGRMMDRPASSKKIADFVSVLGIDMNEAQRSINEFKTFNEFFIRKLKADARPIDMDREAIVSPADGKLLAFEGAQGLERFFVKGQEFSLESFLQDRTLSEKYAEGILIILRLAPADYHRFHFPADGYISTSTRIEGDYYSVSPYAVKRQLRIYWENVREYSLLRTADAGDILISEVGATMVGSIAQSYHPESLVQKGQEKGWFSFGGSTVIMLFEAGKVQVDSDILNHTAKGYETSIKMGERLARILQ